MTISFSCRCPNANCLGFDAVFVNDHIIVDNSARSAPWTNTYDPFVALSITLLDRDLEFLVAISADPQRTQAYPVRCPPLQAWRLALRWTFGERVAAGIRSLPQTVRGKQ
jgi:hypothetical protein